VQIVGVSFNKPAANKLFKENEEFQYPLWSDLDRELALAYGAATSPSQGTAKRITVVLAPDGTWVLVYPNVDFVLFQHVEQVLSDMTALVGAN
jgi:peroxiredoxin